MSMRYPGGLIATSPVNAAYPSGVWTPSQSIPYQQQNVWTRDQYWPYTTLLLNGNGTNGAQNNTFLDSSTNNFTITRNGNTTQGSFTPYEANGYWSNYFDGTDDYLTYANNTAFAFGTGAFTIEFWVNSNGVSDGFILSGRAAIGTMHITYGGFGGSTAGSLRYVGSSTITSGSVLISNGAWNHCAIVRDGSNNITLYVNGVSVGTGTDSTNYTTTTGTWYINANDSGPTAGGAGYISNLRIVKGTVVYTAAFTPPNTPLTAITNTSLLTCQSNRFIDNSTNAFAITRNGDTSVQAFQPFPGATTWSGSVLSGSGYFDGSGDYLTLATNTALDMGTGNFTVEMWVYSTDASADTQNRRFFATDVNGTASIQIGHVTTTTGVAQYCDNGSLGVLITGTTNILNQWAHIAVVRSSGTVTLYVNGVSEGTPATDTGNKGSASFTIGKYPGASGHMKGFMGSLRVVKGTAVYTGNFTPPTAPLTAITNTQLLLNFTNSGITDSATMSDFETAGNAQVSTSVVKYGTGSMYFDGTGDYVLAKNTQANWMGTGDFTIEAWIYLTAAQGDRHITDSTASGGLFLKTEASTVGIGRATIATDNMFSYSFSQNTWYHVAFCRKGTTVYGFVDGVSIGSGSNSVNYTQSGGLAIGSGGSLSGGFWNGYIDDLRITKGFARYITNFTPPPARLPPQ